MSPIPKRLYAPDSPARIPGRAYEKFLSREARKAGGVYYTPACIIDYIVKQTVGKLLEASPGKPLKILDPACGSGFFLIRAYQFLLDWHLEQYVKDHPEKRAKGKKPALYQTDSGGWRLTADEHRRILLNSIFGVDIDPKAVELTKVSLLKLLEGEDRQCTGKNRVLSDLANNIKCGNSLIGPDFYENRQMNLDEDEIYRINVFDWHAEFPEIMKNGGFDAVIGNPPWGAKFTQLEKEYFRRRFENFHVRTPESFNYFVGQMWNLTCCKGSVGVIIPSSFLNQHEFWKTRKFLAETANVSRICNLGDGIFDKVTAPSCIIIFGAANKNNSPLFSDFRKDERTSLPLLLGQENRYQNASLLGRDSDSYILQIRSGGNIIQKSYQWPRLREIAEDVATGVSSGLDKAYIYTPAQVKNLNLEPELLRKLIIGREIGRYWLRPESGRQLIYITSDIKIEKYPCIQSVLLPHRERLKKRREAANGKIPWYALNWPRRKKLFEQPKILIRQTSDHIMASYDTDKWYCLKSGIIIQLPNEVNIRYEYLLGLLNSRLFRYLYNDLAGEQTRVFPEVKPVQLFKLPIRTIRFDAPEEKNCHDLMTQLVEQLLNLHKQLAQAALPQEKTVLSRQIEAADRQIDQLVYQLYDLTEEEIKIAEGES